MIELKPQSVGEAALRPLGPAGSSVPVDAALSGTSENPVQNKVIKEAIDAKYTKPAGGIPKADLAGAVQQSLSAADTALQPAALAPYATKAWVEQQGYLTQHQDLSGKQDKNMGAANAGKFLVVGSDGVITAVTMTAWQGGSY